MIFTGLSSGGHRGGGIALDWRPITSIKEEESQKLLRIEEELPQGA